MAKKEHQEKKKEEANENSEEKVIVEKEKEIDKAEGYLNSWKRCQADFENYKKRQEEARKELREYAKEGILLQLLPVVDNFHASTDHVPEDQKDQPWVTGIMYIQKQLEKLLEDNGAVEIRVNIGDKFDPEIHEAVSHEGEGEKIHPVKSAEGGPAEQEFNRVKKVISKGYKLGGKVIRAAKVIVS